MYRGRNNIDYLKGERWKHSFYKIRFVSNAALNRRISVKYRSFHLEFGSLYFMQYKIILYSLSHQKYDTWHCGRMVFPHNVSKLVLMMGKNFITRILCKHLNFCIFKCISEFRVVQRVI